jgi:NhaA family Na+:H+ antiporter
MLAANLLPYGYYEAIHWRPFDDVALLGQPLDLHFIVNDVFSVFFFGVAAKEITGSCLPGGVLHPPAKAMNPLFATLGGVVGPVTVFFVGLSAGTIGRSLSLKARTAAPVSIPDGG